MYTEQKIEDLKKKLAALPGSHYSGIAKKSGLARSTVVRFFESDNKTTRLSTADKIYDSALTYIEEVEKKLENRNRKARRLIYGEKENEKEPDASAAQGELDLKTQ